jgi:hypothetical protein
MEPDQLDSENCVLTWRAFSLALGEYVARCRTASVDLGSAFADDGRHPPISPAS